MAAGTLLLVGRQAYQVCVPSGASSMDTPTVLASHLLTLVCGTGKAAQFRIMGNIQPKTYIQTSRPSHYDRVNHCLLLTTTQETNKSKDAQ